MASIDLNKLIQEQILTAAKNQELVQESVTGNQDRYDIANALNEDFGSVKDEARREAIAVAQRQAKDLSSKERSALNIPPYNSTLTSQEASKLHNPVKPEEPGLVDKVVKGVQDLPTWAKVGAGVGAGALGAGLAAKKYLASRKAKAGK
jgi:hypothetical protein